MIKILGEKPTKLSSILLKFVCSKNKFTIRQATNSSQVYYEVPVIKRNKDFYIGTKLIRTNRRVVDALSQINQHAKPVTPYVVLTFVGSNDDDKNDFCSVKYSFTKSFKNIIIL